MICLVTGGAGFIGSNLVLELEKKGHEVIVAVDNLFSGAIENLKDFKGKFIEWDVSEKKDFQGGIDVIFHQAAITDPRYDGKEDIFKKNVDGFKNMIELALEKNAKLIYASSASVYGNGPCPMNEDQEKFPQSDYARSKLEMDNIAKNYFNKINIVGLRYFNVFGPGESHKGRPASMVYHLRKQILKGERPTLFFPGDQARDNIYVKDVVRANLLAIGAKSGVYNVGTGIKISFNEIVKVLNEVLNTNAKQIYVKNPYEGYQEQSQADTFKAERFLRFKAEWKFKDAVKDYNEWLIKNGE
ncbi:MAG: NAD-dependent epimerase/dehydratase family protein [Candidatus Nanoarchaeia archaeon]|nr:NAD-dependent epimerase/dehydratase family protein [Candidatus Nanoarchaeia archaeon]